MKLWEIGLNAGDRPYRITSYNVCYTKLLRSTNFASSLTSSALTLNCSTTTSLMSSKSAITAPVTRIKSANYITLSLKKLLPGFFQKGDEALKTRISVGSRAFWQQLRNPLRRPLPKRRKPVQKEMARRRYAIFMPPFVITSYSIHYTKLYEARR